MRHTGRVGRQVGREQEAMGQASTALCKCSIRPSQPLASRHCGMGSTQHDKQPPTVKVHAAYVGSTSMEQQASRSLGGLHSKGCNGEFVTQVKAYELILPACKHETKFGVESARLLCLPTNLACPRRLACRQPCKRLTSSPKKPPPCPQHPRPALTGCRTWRPRWGRACGPPSRPSGTRGCPTACCRSRSNGTRGWSTCGSRPTAARPCRQPGPSRGPCSRSCQGVGDRRWVGGCVGDWECSIGPEL